MKAWTTTSGTIEEDLMPDPDADLDPVERAARCSDVYVFYRGEMGVVPGFVPGEHPKFRFLADMEACSESWPWSAFGIIEPDDLLEVRIVAEEVQWGPEDPPDETASTSKFGPRALRRTKHFPHFGFARLRVERGSAQEVLDAINDESTPGYSGSALVRGKFDILVEIGGDSSEEVCDHLQALGDVAGVTDVTSGRVTDHFYKPLDP
jgi:hypothetical protein